MVSNGSTWRSWGVIIMQANSGLQRAEHTVRKHKKYQWSIENSRHTEDEERIVTCTGQGLM